VNRTLGVVLCLTAIVVGWLVYSKSSPPPAASASLLPKVENRKIYFVPIGNFPDEQLQPLVQYYRKKYNLEIAVADGISVDTATRDASRQQLMAESLADIAQPMTRDIPAMRLRKIVTKDIGILYYGLPQSNDLHSVLYNQIMGIEELDAVGEDF